MMLEIPTLLSSFEHFFQLCKKLKISMEINKISEYSLTSVTSI